MSVQNIVSQTPPQKVDILTFFKCHENDIKWAKMLKVYGINIFFPLTDMIY